VTAKCTSLLQTRPLVREGATQRDDRKYPTLIHTNLVVGLRWEPDSKRNWPTDRRSQYYLKLDRKSGALYFGRDATTILESILPPSF
jgi:hypothetical protein